MQDRMVLANYARNTVGPVTLNSQTKDKGAHQRYLDSILHPFDCGGVKVPTGFPAVSTTVTIRKTYAVSFTSATNMVINGTSYTILAGTPICFMFQPELGFDYTNISTVTFATIANPIWNAANIANIAPSYGYTGNYSSQRIVSAGMRYTYTGAPLYAQGLVTSLASNYRNNNEFVTAGYSQFIADPNAKNVPALTPIQQNWTPRDISCLEFITLAGIPTSQDWTGYLGISNYNYASCTFLIDTVINYELIPTAAFMPISGATPAPKGNAQIAHQTATDAGEIIREADRAFGASQGNQWIEGARNFISQTQDIMTGTGYENYNLYDWLTGYKGKY